MNILVLGSAGQLGSSLKKVSADEPSLSLTFLDHEMFNLLWDKDKKMALVQDHQPQVIINCAAYTQVDKAEADSELAFQINGHALKDISEIANEGGSQLIHVSTDFVFSGDNNSPYRETDKTGPLSVYGESKLLGESIIQDLCENYAIFRTSWLYSNDHPCFYKTMLRLGGERDSLNVVDDQVGSPTWVDDLARGILHYLKSHSGTDKNIYHFSNEGQCSWYEFAKAIFELKKVDIQLQAIPTSDYPTPATRPKYSVMSKEKFSTELNYSVPHWLDSLKTMSLS